MPHVLIVDDDDNTRAALHELVSGAGFTTAQAGNLREARMHVVRQRPDVVLIDLVLPDGNGMDLARDLDEHASTEIILITGHASVESAVEALRLGATDYLVKPINLQRVNAVLSRVPRTAELKAEIGSLRGELRRLGHFGRLIGNSPAMQTLYDQIARVAPTEATVLVIGESGTGKELVAQTIFELSRRRRQPFYALNCGAISPQLIETEMFGHERGSFTGAERQHIGYFERAHGGTLFLDEITEMPQELQVTFLRVLETGKFLRVGGRTEIESDVRVIAATNRDPKTAIAEGKLRSDLYHRLNVFPLTLQPLRERGKDVQLLAQHFLDELNAAEGTQKKFPARLLAELSDYSWPGNIRELRNYVHRLYILADEMIDYGSLAIPQLREAHQSTGSTLTIPIGTSLAEVDRQLILSTLQQCGGVKKRAADILGISLKTLYNRLVEYRPALQSVAAGNGLDERPQMKH